MTIVELMVVQVHRKTVMMVSLVIGILVIQKLGLCIHKEIPDFCSASSRCTVGFCNNLTNKCDQRPISCDDGNPCTLDTCNPSLGCRNIISTSICSDYKKCTTDICISDGSGGYTCSNVFSPSNCLPAPSNFPSDCGTFSCDSTSDCGVKLNTSLCVRRSNMLTCENLVCNSLSGFGDTQGCDRVTTCELDCECVSTPMYPTGTCVCTRASKRNLNLDDSSSIVMGSNLIIALFFILGLLSW